MSADNHWLQELINGPQTDYPVRVGRSQPESPLPPNPNKRKPRYKWGTKRDRTFERECRGLWHEPFLRTPAYYALRAVYLSSKPLTVDQVANEAPDHISTADIREALDKLVVASKRWVWIRVKKFNGLYQTVRSKR